MNYANALAALALAATTALPAFGQEVVAPAPIVAGGNTTIVYVFPTSPQTFVPVAGLPSFLAMPGAEIPPVATQVVYTTPVPVPAGQLVASIDVDCSNFSGTVTIAGPDTFGLDKDGDGIGCEPEDR